MHEELLPTQVAISVLASISDSNHGGHTSSPSSSNLQQETITEEDPQTETNHRRLSKDDVPLTSNLATGHSSSNQASRRVSLVRSRKKSRKLTLTQVCAEEAVHSPSVLSSPTTNRDNFLKAEAAEPAVLTDDDRVSNSSSLISSSSSSSSSAPEMSSSSASTGPPSGPERKISRIFSMLQSMQQTFMQQQQHQHHHQQQQQQQQQHYQSNPPSVATRVAEGPQPAVTNRDKQEQEDLANMMASAGDTSSIQQDRSDELASRNDKLESLRRQGLHLDLHQASAPPRQLLYGLGRSQDSLMFAANSGSLPRTNVNTMERQNNRYGSVKSSWAGSQYSGFTCTTATGSAIEGQAPTSAHNGPFHKNGWTSLFIVGSSTYAQLLIVICIVAALSEVVTHNVPFLYFEGFFSYLYTVSIVFFLYVFGYLLRSKKRIQEKKRLRKLSRMQRGSSVMSFRSMSDNRNDNPDPMAPGHSSGTFKSRNPSLSLENEVVVASTAAATPLNRFMDSIRGQRRRFSRTDSTSSSVVDSTSKAVSQNPHPNKQFQWTPSSVSFSLVDESPTESAIAYAMSPDSVLGSDQQTNGNRRNMKKMKVSDNEHSHGSFFLRAGAVAFGLGTMIYDGLEFGAFLEIPPDSPCFALLRGINPILHATFVFLQMYFIFVSARLNIHKFKALARFGLMHCLATNVCVWVRTLVRESLKEINGHYHHYEKSHLHQVAQQQQAAAAEAMNNQVGNLVAAASEVLYHHVAQVVNAPGLEDDSGSVEFINETAFAEALSSATASAKDGMSLWELTGNVSCGRRIFLGDLIMDAAPFLYPFLIEYSLIGAAVLYVIWSQVGLNPKYKTEENRIEDSIWNSKSRQLRVDCVGASKGLFIGLFFLTASLLCLVLFFIFAPQPQFHGLGLFLADAAHCTLLIVSLFAIAIGAYRTRDLHFHSEHMEELGSILLRVSAIGIFAYSVFSMIAGALAGTPTHEPPVLVLINGLLSVIEVTVQMLFMSDMSRRRVSTPEQDRVKPGRQSVTFLLITNLTLWLVYTFEMQKVEANPVQLNFYGFLPWAIVQRITLPLCIFYRFHSAIVYAEIWKNSYRYHHGSSSVDTLQPPYMVS